MPIRYRPLRLRTKYKLRTSSHRTSIKNVHIFCSFYNPFSLSDLWYEHFFELADNEPRSCKKVVPPSEVAGWGRKSVSVTSCCLSSTIRFLYRLGFRTQKSSAPLSPMRKYIYTWLTKMTFLWIITKQSELKAPHHPTLMYQISSVPFSLSPTKSQLT